MEALKDPDGASFSYMLPNTSIQWGPYCSDCLNSWHSDSFFPRDILIFPHIQGKSEAICLGDLELENGSTNPFTPKGSLSDLISLNCSKKECPNYDRFVVKRPTTMKHKTVETIRLKTSGRETQTDKMEPSVKTVATNTVSIAAVKAEKNFPCLFGHIKAVDPMTEEQTWLAWNFSPKAYQKKEAVVLGEILTESGYRIQSCVACSARFDSFDSMISHVLNKSHVQKVLKADRRFSYSQDLRILKHLLLDIDMKSELRKLTTITEPPPAPKEVSRTLKVEPKAKSAVKTPVIANPQKKTSGIAPKTATPSQPIQGEKKKECPFLTGRRDLSDPISVTEENEAIARMRKGVKDDAAIMNKLLVQQGYKLTKCSACGIKFCGPVSALSHALSDSHRTTIRGGSLQFSRSMDLNELERLYETVELMKAKATTATKQTANNKKTESKPSFPQSALVAAKTKTTVVAPVQATKADVKVKASSRSIRRARDWQLRVKTTSSDSKISKKPNVPGSTSKPRSTVIASPLTPIASAHAPAALFVSSQKPLHTQLKPNFKLQPMFTESEKHIITWGGATQLLENTAAPCIRNAFITLCTSGGGRLQDYDHECRECAFISSCVCELLFHIFSEKHIRCFGSVHGELDDLNYWIDKVCLELNLPELKKYCWEGILDDNGQFLNNGTSENLEDYRSFKSEAANPGRCTIS